MNYLIIETSTEKGLIGCVKGGRVIFSEELPSGMNQSRYLLPELSKWLKLKDIRSERLDFIGLGKGPGSYTGIRIGASVAQALAYAWAVPLVGVSSLDGFVPAEREGEFAAMIDARVGGAYVRKGQKKGSGVTFTTEPLVVSLEELPDFLGVIDRLVTPNAFQLKARLEKVCPGREWRWEERYPSLEEMGRILEQCYERGEVEKPGELNLFYLRKTEAEREKERKNNQNVI